MDFINQIEPWIDENEVIHMTEYLQSGGWLTEFKKTAEFEQMIAGYTGSKYCCVVTNGTISLAIALWAAGIGEGDEVLVPDYTMIATPNAVRLVGATPVLVDISPQTLCMDIECAEKVLTERTKAISPVSLNGRSPDMQAYQSFCKKHELFFLEDAAQSLGSFHNGKHLGTFGEVVLFHSVLRKSLPQAKEGRW